MNDKPVQICPYLGLVDEPETAHSFPSHENRCFHVKPPAPLALEYQYSCCLTPDYLECDIYKANPAYAFPDRIKDDQQGDAKGKRSLTGLGISLGVLVLEGILVWLVFSHGLLGFPALGYSLWGRTSPTMTKTAPTLSIFPTQVKATPAPMTSSPTSLPTVIPPTLTPTIPPSRALETPIGRTTQLIIHQVRMGESLDLIARLYTTTVEAIKTVNYIIPTPLQVNSLVIVPFQRTDVRNLPSFTVFQVKVDMSVEELADQIGVDPALLILYNESYDGEVLKQGDWVLVPHLGSATP